MPFWERLVSQYRESDHLSCEAIVAYVDGELDMVSHLRAAHHVACCPQCHAEIEAQYQARNALRCCDQITMPTALRQVLSFLPEEQQPCSHQQSQHYQHDHFHQEGHDS